MRRREDPGFDPQHEHASFAFCQIRDPSRFLYGVLLSNCGRDYLDDEVVVFKLHEGRGFTTNTHMPRTWEAHKNYSLLGIHMQ